MDLSGRKLEKYELIERLGKGGTAEVYKACQVGLQRYVAIKILHSHLADSTDFISRFLREAQSIGQLRHPHILRILDFDTENDLHYIVMDHLPNGTLEEYLMTHRTLPVEKSLQLTAQMASALTFAHQHGIVHRDIKPGNVMFSDGTYTNVVLTDFGLAGLLDNASHLTPTGALVGTPAYMSPEAARGEICDERSDVYGLGLVLYRMITGQTAHDADTPYGWITKHANEPIPAPRTIRAEIPQVVETLLLTALAKKPDQRFQSTSAFFDAIQRTLYLLNSNTPVQPPPPYKAPRKQSKEQHVPFWKNISISLNHLFSRFNTIDWSKNPPAMCVNRWLSLATVAVCVMMVAILTSLLLMGWSGESRQLAAGAFNTSAVREEVIPVQPLPAPSSRLFNQFALPAPSPNAADSLNSAVTNATGFLAIPPEEPQDDQKDLPTIVLIVPNHISDETGPTEQEPIEPTNLESISTAIDAEPSVLFDSAIGGQLENPDSNRGVLESSDRNRSGGRNRSGRGNDSSDRRHTNRKP